MNNEFSLQKGKIRVLKTNSPKPVVAFAVRVLMENGSKAVILDASARINPYWVVRICKRLRCDKRDILDRIMVSRGFTAYQILGLVEDVEQLIQNQDIIFLGIVNLGGRFLDDDINKEEGNFLRSECVKKIKEIVKEKGLYCVIGDGDPKGFVNRIDDEFYREEKIRLKNEDLRSYG
ncbi:MAG: hypothetical protein ACOC85_04945 [Thermoplasmatota archaeon]